MAWHKYEIKWNCYLTLKILILITAIFIFQINSITKHDCTIVMIMMFWWVTVLTYINIISIWIVISSSGVAWVFFLVRQIHRAQRGGKMLGVGPEIKKKWAIETHFPEFKWIIYDFNNNWNNTQKTISICVKWLVCEFISEPLEWLHEASSRVSDRIDICNRIKNEKIK
jgi:hypothetical protein